MMRIKPIDALFPSTRQAILGSLLLQPARWWYLSDLTAHLGRNNPSSLQRELESLVSAGILTRREEGNRVYFRANQECPIFAELAALLAKTTGLVDVVHAALGRLKDRIRLAFLHGSVVRGEERAASDVDLVVVGGLGLSDIAPNLRVAEEQLGRAVNVMVYSEHEFVAKLKAGHHFLNKVVDDEKWYLIGSQHELEELACGRARAAACDQQAGAG